MTLSFSRIHSSLALLSVLVFLAGATRAMAAPSIQSVTVQPAALQVGQSFTVAVTASADVTQGSATVDFRPWAARVMRLVLVKQGSQWVATGIVPADLVPPSGAKATVTAIMLNAARASVSASITPSVSASPVGATATFAGGVLTVTGTPQNDTLTVSRAANDNLLVNNGAIPITGGVPTATNTTLVRLLGLPGDDVLTMNESGGLLPPSQIVGDLGKDTLTGGSAADDLDGGPGDDILLGGSGDDLLKGGTGNDQISGGRGNDLALGGDNNDTFFWAPGDGSDVLEGEGGTDTMAFTGANISEHYDVAPNGSRLRFFRDVANIVMDCNSVEKVALRALGGADVITVNELTGAGVTEVRVDLASATPGTGDGQADQVIVNGTNLADVIDVTSTATETTVHGLAATVVVATGEAAIDHILVNGLGEEDTIDASGVSAGAELMLNGGSGNDILIGSAVADIIAGGPGIDVVLAGGGDDILTWSPGDASDVLEGQDGIDTLAFTGANISEVFDIAANGGRVVLFRNVAAIVMDCNDVERFDLTTLGGSDVVNVHDLKGTDVTLINVGLASTAGTGDGAADNVVVDGTAGDDVMVASGSAGAATVVLDGPAIQITGAEAANDRLTIRSLAGDDVIEASGLQASTIAFTGDGGDNNDILVGGDGDDTLIGGPGDDVLLGGPGLDVLDGGSGSNVVIQ